MNFSAFLLPLVGDADMDGHPAPPVGQLPSPGRKAVPNWNLAVLRDTALSEPVDS